MDNSLSKINSERNAKNDSSGSNIDAHRSPLSLDLIYKRILRISGNADNSLNPSQTTSSIGTNQSNSDQTPTLISNSKSCSTPIELDDNNFHFIAKTEYQLNSDQMHEFRSKANDSVESRLRFIDEFSSKSIQLTEQTYSRIFTETAQLLDKSQPTEVRHKVWRFYCQLFQGHTENLGQLRYYLFDLISTNDARSEDIPYRIELLIALTDSGKSLLYYETQIADFMVRLYSNLIEKKVGTGPRVKHLDTTLQQNFLELMIGLIKYNAAHFGTDKPQALKLMICYVYELAHQSTNNEELRLIYQFMNVILSYSHLPTDILDQFVIVLCIGVHNDEQHDICNKIMRNLIGNYLGFSCLSTLLHIIEDETNFHDKMLIRGAVYFLSNSLWGNLANKVFLSPNTVLPAFKNLLLNESITSPDIALGIADAVYTFLQHILDPKKQNRQSDINLQCDLFNEKTREIIFENTWELVLDIAYYLNVASSFKNGSHDFKPQIILIVNFLLKLLDKKFGDNIGEYNSMQNELSSETTNISIALLLVNDIFVEKIFSIIELGINLLDESSIMKLVCYRLIYIGENRANWIQQLKHVIDVYYVNDSFAQINRNDCLSELQKYLDAYRNFIDVDNFWEKVGSFYFHQQSDLNSREHAVNFLIYLAIKLNVSKNLNEIIEIFENIANNCLKSFDAIWRQHSVELNPTHRSHNSQISHQYSAPNETTQTNDFIQAINGLIVIFLEKIDHISCHVAAVNAFNLLIKFSSFFYKYNTFEDIHSLPRTRTVFKIKSLIFDLILSLRTNSIGQLGVVRNRHPKQHIYSPGPHAHHLLRNEEIIKFSSYVMVCDSVSFVSTAENISPPSSPQQPQTSFSQSSATHQNLQRQQSCSAQLCSSPSISSHFHSTFSDALKLVIKCIDVETEWSVLEMIFDELPTILKHKCLLISNCCQSTSTSPSSSTTQLNRPEPSLPDQLLNSLCKFIDSLQSRLNEINFGEISKKLTKADILSRVYHSISALVGYKFPSSSQTLIIKCLLNGLVQFSSKTASVRQCIVSLTLCSMEMQTAMNKSLHEIIISLSKIGTNKTFAVPKLEFLLNLILFPDFYYTFTIKQYLEIFMIAQSYINPYKYGEFTVALALRVISMWFLKCPVSSRFFLVKYLIKGLQTNILKEVEPSTPLPRLTSVGSYEHRSKMENLFSLTSSPPPPPTTPVNASSSQFSFLFQSSANSPLDLHHSHSISASTSSAFNVPSSSSSMTTEGLILDQNDKENSKIELVEVCMDMLASNAFTTSSPLPLRPSMIDKLLNKEKSQTWIIGHKLIQITTTGCTSRAVRNGLCSKCHTICHMNGDIIKESPLPTTNMTFLPDRFGGGGQLSHDYGSSSASMISARRRHRSEINSSNSALKNSMLVNDDYFINRNSNNSASDSDLNNDSKYCRCWCQNWAEILVRRATGNTRWIMRVENSLGDFPNWNFSKEEDDTLANIFKHSDPEINLALKLQKASQFESDENINRVDSLKSLNHVESAEKNLDEIPATLEATPTSKSRVSMPVTRAASFGSRRPIYQHNIATDHQTAQPLSPDSSEQVRTQVLRRLEKNYSFDEDDSLPPESPSSKANQSNNSSSETISTIAAQESCNLNNNNVQRDRGYTISVMTPVQKSASSSVVSGNIHQSSIYDNSSSSSNLNLSTRQSVSVGGLSPQFVFLQLYYNSVFKDDSDPSSLEKPIQLDKKDQIARSIKCLDCITPYGTHKIGVLYVGPGQANNKAEILANQVGSYRYTRFLTGLGQTIALQEVDPKVCYVGGLDPSRDGPFAISWGDHLIQVIFHVATFMPTMPNDPNGNNKMTHIGNDFVCIVYNNSGDKIDFSTIKGDGQVLQAMIVITPLNFESNIVEIQAKTEFTEFICHLESQMLSDHALPIYVRQLALHANLGAMVSHPNKSLKSYHIWNWVTRLRNIKRIRARASEPTSGLVDSGHPSSKSTTLQQSHGRPLGRPCGEKLSKEDSESSVLSSAASPGYQSGSSFSGSSNGVFDYDAGFRFTFPDFTDFAKEQ